MLAMRIDPAARIAGLPALHARHVCRLVVRRTLPGPVGDRARAEFDAVVQAGELAALAAEGFLRPSPPGDPQLNAALPTAHQRAWLDRGPPGPPGPARTPPGGALSDTPGATGATGANGADAPEIPPAGWRLTPAGIALARAYRLHQLSPGQAALQVTRFLERAVALNASPHVLGAITEVTIFGDYLQDLPAIEGLDLSVRWQLRVPEDAGFRALRRAHVVGCRAIGLHVPAVRTWPWRELRRGLVGYSRDFQLHAPEAIPEGAPTQVLLRVDPATVTSYGGPPRALGTSALHLWPTVGGGRGLGIDGEDSEDTGNEDPGAHDGEASDPRGAPGRRRSLDERRGAGV